MPKKLQVLVRCGDCGAPLDSRYYEDLAALLHANTEPNSDLKGVPDRCDTCTRRLSTRPNLILVK